jgi:hypothetical protein
MLRLILIVFLCVFCFVYIYVEVNIPCHVWLLWSTIYNQTIRLGFIDCVVYYIFKLFLEMFSQSTLVTWLWIIKILIQLSHARGFYISELTWSTRDCSTYDQFWILGRLLTKTDFTEVSTVSFTDTVSQIRSL